MKKFFYATLMLFMPIVCGQLQAATITLSGTEFNSCTYTKALTDYKGDVIVICDPNGSSVARIGGTVLKKYNSCRYIGITTYDDGNIQGLCSLSIGVIPVNPPKKLKSNYDPTHTTNPDICIGKDGLYAWAPCDAEY